MSRDKVLFFVSVCLCASHRGRDAQTDRQTDRHTHTHTHTRAHTQGHTHNTKVPDQGPISANLF